MKHARRLLVALSVGSMVFTCGARLLAAPVAPAPAVTATPDKDKDKPVRRLITAPPDFIKTTVGVPLIYAKGDEGWVKQSVAAVKPASRPAMMPNDLADKLAKDRLANLALVKKDLGLADDKAIGAFYDDKLVGGLRKIEGWAPVIYYMPITGNKLKDVVKAGWECNQFYYNRIGDSVNYDPRYNWPNDAAADESVLPLFYSSDDLEQVRMKALTERIQDNENGRLSMVAVMGRQRAVQLYNDMITEQVTKALGLKRDQEWLGMGIAGVLTAKYVAALTGIERDTILNQLVSAINSGIPVDLLQPTPEDQLRPEAVAAYNETMRAKAIIKVATWMKAKDDVIVKAVSAVREKKPATGANMITVLKEATGTDDLEKLLAQ